MDTTETLTSNSHHQRTTTNTSDGVFTSSYMKPVTPLPGQSATNGADEQIAPATDSTPSSPNHTTYLNSAPHVDNIFTVAKKWFNDPSDCTTGRHVRIRFAVSPYHDPQPPIPWNFQLLPCKIREIILQKLTPIDFLRLATQFPALVKNIIQLPFEEFDTEDNEWDQQRALKVTKTQNLRKATLTKRPMQEEAEETWMEILTSSQLKELTLKTIPRPKSEDKNMMTPSRAIAPHATKITWHLDTDFSLYATHLNKTNYCTSPAVNTMIFDSKTEGRITSLMYGGGSLILNHVHKYEFNITLERTFWEYARQTLQNNPVFGHSFTCIHELKIQPHIQEHGPRPPFEAFLNLEKLCMSCKGYPKAFYEWFLQEINVFLVGRIKNITLHDIENQKDLLELTPWDRLNTHAPLLEVITFKFTGQVHVTRIRQLINTAYDRDITVQFL